MTSYLGGWRAWVFIGLVALGVRAALLPVFPIPAPSVHDEFSYLLGADTFRLGRLTNPPHPMWVHFETFHVNFQPTYASKYPPAQALFLALGWKLFGHPWFGVWLSMGLMCAALCWMFQGWMATRYALIGGLMAVAQWGISGYWINSYWGGAVAAAAGALMIGAVPRLARRPAPGVAAIAAIGALVLANSRPYEGGLTVIAAFVALIYLRRRDLFLSRIVWPIAVIAAAGVAAMAYYNDRVTGDPLLLPYALNERTYGASPLFWMQSPHPSPPYRHDVLRKFWEDWDKPIFNTAHTMPATVPLIFARKVVPFYLTPLTGLALLAAIVARRGRKVRLALAMLAVPVGGLLLERYSQEHYLSPATGLVLLLVMLGVQWCRTRFGQRGLALFAVLFFAHANWTIAHDPMRHVTTFGDYRQQVLQSLQAKPGKQLVIVRYAPNHKVLNEWVYNRADIDASQVVWARDMGADANRELLDYYRGRTAWLLEPDGPNPVPVPYAY